jgi:PKHD-type hydroxylase
MEKTNSLCQNNNMTNYYYYPKIISDDEIEKIIEISNKYYTQDGNVSGTVDYNYRKSKITWLPQNEETQFIYDKIIHLMKDTNSKMWNFNITNLVDDLQLAEYSEGDIPGHYDWHMDFGVGSSTRKISLSIQLSDENSYEGGDLEFMIHRSIIKAPREKGTCVFFPSYLTHRVTNITKGSRRSLVIWFHGPTFI